MLWCLSRPVCGKLHYHLYSIIIDQQAWGEQMTRTVAEDPQEQRVINDIQTYGWHCVHIAAEDDLPPFSFTVGLFHSFKQPELIIFGLRQEVAHRIFCIAVDAMKAGTPIDLSKPTELFVEGYPSVFVAVPKAQYDEHVGFCLWYYEGEDFPLYQIVWPSRDKRLPWEPEASDAFRAMQPVLGDAAEHS